MNCEKPAASCSRHLTSTTMKPNTSTDPCLTPQKVVLHLTCSSRRTYSRAAEHLVHPHWWAVIDSWTLGGTSLWSGPQELENNSTVNRLQDTEICSKGELLRTPPPWIPCRFFLKLKYKQSNNREPSTARQARCVKRLNTTRSMPDLHVSGCRKFGGLIDFYIKLWDVRSFYKPGTLKPANLYNHPLAPDLSTLCDGLGYGKMCWERSISCMFCSFIWSICTRGVINEIADLKLCYEDASST